jgi:hypothetical protein
MAMEAWPSLLPFPTTAYKIEPKNAVIETTFETGAPLQRLRFGEHFELVRASWLFSNKEFLIFKNWFATKLLRGTKKFDMQLYLGDSVDTYETQWVSGSEPYQVSHRGVLYWGVTATLLVQDTKEVSEAVLDILLEGEQGENDFLVAISNLDSLVEITLPSTTDNLP